MADSQKTLVIVGWLWPLPALPLFLWLTMEGVLNFGGGEKDILMVIPATFYSLLYWVAFFIWRRRRVSPGKAILYALGTALLTIFLVGFAFASSSAFAAETSPGRAAPNQNSMLASSPSRLPRPAAAC